MKYTLIPFMLVLAIACAAEPQAPEPAPAEEVAAVQQDLVTTPTMVRMLGGWVCDTEFAEPGAPPRVERARVKGIPNPAVPGHTALYYSGRYRDAQGQLLSGLNIEFAFAGLGGGAVLHHQFGEFQGIASTTLADVHGVDDGEYITFAGTVFGSPFEEEWWVSLNGKYMTIYAVAPSFENPVVVLVDGTCWRR